MTNHQHNFVLARLMRPRMLSILLGLIVLATLIFRRFPEIDIEASRLFYDQGFYLSDQPLWRSIRSLSIVLTKLLVPLLVVLWIIRLWRPKVPQLLSFARLGFVSVSLIMGPLLITNLVLKDHWGRARPRSLDIFGGDKDYSLPWSLSDQCVSNCSFISGETSSALWLLTLIVFLPLQWHGRAVVAVGLYTLLISTLRIGFGGHFLSDTIFSILVNMLAFWWVWGWFFDRGTNPHPLAWANETRANGYFYSFRQASHRLATTISLLITLAYSRAMDKVRRKI